MLSPIDPEVAPDAGSLNKQVVTGKPSLPDLSPTASAFTHQYQVWSPLQASRIPDI